MSSLSKLVKSSSIYKIEKMLRDGTANGKPLTEKQIALFKAALKKMKGLK